MKSFSQQESNSVLYNNRVDEVEGRNRMMRTSMKLGKLAAVIALASGGALLASEGAAVAGTNGQQVGVYNANTNSTSQDICGYNQYDNWACTGWSPSNPRGSVAVRYNYWFKSASGIYGYQNVRIYLNTGGYYSCYVPPVSNSNIWICTI